MSKLAAQIIIVGILIAAAATINIIGVDASQGAEILQISVRAQSNANYNVDTDFGTIPAISIDIVDDTINDQSSNGSKPLVAPLSSTVPLQDSHESQASHTPQATHTPLASHTPKVKPGSNGNYRSHGNPKP